MVRKCRTKGNVKSISYFSIRRVDVTARKVPCLIDLNECLTPQCYNPQR